MLAKHQRMIVLLGSLLTGLISCGDGGAPDLPSTVLPEAWNLYTDHDFAFTLSPDNRWLLYFERDPSAAFWAGGLRVLDLKDERLHRFDLPMENDPGPLGFTMARWSSDSRFFAPRTFAIVIANDEPELITELHGKYEKRLADERITVEEASHCSDCYGDPHKFEWEKKIKSIIGQEHWRGGTGSFDQILSPDGKTVFYQQGAQTSTLKIYARNSESGKDRLITTHRGSCVRAGNLRLSPDGRLLAYQLGAGCSSFAKPSRIYIVDVESGERRHVGSDVFDDVSCTMHWTSDSSRLYFAGWKRGGLNNVAQVAYVDMPSVEVEHASPTTKSDNNDE